MVIFATFECMLNLVEQDVDSEKKKGQSDFAISVSHLIYSAITWNLYNYSLKKKKELHSSCQKYSYAFYRGKVNLMEHDQLKLFVGGEKWPKAFKIGF